MKPATSYPGTQAVRRSVGLLKAFTADRPQRGLAELARAVGLNKTTAFRMLAALEGEGMVERTPAGDAYRLGPELLLLAGRAGGAHDLRAAARTELEALARATRETATLEVLVGRATLILDEATGGHMVGARPSLGTSWPAHATSTGKVLLAHLEGERRAAALRRLVAGADAADGDGRGARSTARWRGCGRRVTPSRRKSWSRASWRWRHRCATRRGRGGGAQRGRPEGAPLGGRAGGPAPAG